MLTVTLTPPLLSALIVFFAPIGSLDRPNEIAQISVDELNNGYIQWMDHHPSAFPPGSKNTILLPSLDIYSPGGISVYHGEDAAKNAAFIRGLPGSIASAKAGSPRPTLQEAMEMIPEFKGRHRVAQAGAQYTLFAVTWADWDHCKPQNDAVAELRKRSRETGVRIIEVRLREVRLRQ